jgi:predicted dienelactone hydrolase
MKLPRIFLIPLILIIVLISAVGPVPAQESTPTLLAEYGPYDVGKTAMTFVDESRDDRELDIVIWYPALIPDGVEAPDTSLSDAEPDTGGAPYPLIMYSHGYGGNSSQLTEFFNYAGQVTSYGFVLVGLNHRDGARMWPSFTERPLDILFALEQLAELAEDNLAGIIDTEHTGILGYSLGGYAALTMAGARVDPMYLSDWCEDQQERSIRYDPCQVASDWDAFTESIAKVNLVTDTLWPSLSDQRIRAIEAWVPWGGPLFGEEGLAAATVPTLIMGATRDRIAPYERDAAFMYTHLGAQERFLLTFVGDDHLFIGSPKNMQPAFHFSMAFFGYYLQEHEDYAEYLTEDFVEQFEYLAWGSYEPE